ncbi:hypothetical protein HanPSC8_Chr17g0774771 [Helianthus annuus]|nr:hypothetical protein HanPSC8_Chr17g0774771 [Helianthus annuus]
MNRNRILNTLDNILWCIGNRNPGSIGGRIMRLKCRTHYGSNFDHLDLLLSGQQPWTYLLTHQLTKSRHLPCHFFAIFSTQQENIRFCSTCVTVPSKTGLEFFQMDLCNATFSRFHLF